MRILVTRGDGRFSEILREHGHEVENLEMIRTEPLEDQSELRRRLEHLNEFDALFFTSPAAAEVFVSEGGEKRFAGKIYALGERSRDVLENAGLRVVYDEAANTSEELIDHLDLAEFAGKKVLFVRGDKSMRTIVERLNGSATVDEVVVYYTKRLKPDDDKLRELRSRLYKGEIECICFFSPSAVENFCRFFDVEDIRAKVAAIGATTADQIRSSRLPVNLIAAKATSDAFANELLEHTKEH